MTEKSLVKYEENEYDKALVVNGSALGLLDQLIELDGQKPYLEISSDEDIQNYFNKKGINVTNKKELENFYNYLENKVAELSESSDERVRLYFEKREYLKQLEALPSNLSKLEQTVSSGFEELKVPFRAVMNYVWDAVINNGFEMQKIDKFGKDEVEILLEREDFDGQKHVSFEMNLNYYGLDLYLYKEKVKEETIKKKNKVLIFTIEYKEKVKKKIKCEKGNFFISSKEIDTCRDYDSVEKWVDNVEELLLNRNEENVRWYTYCIKTVLNLPKIMDNYVKGRQKNLDKMFSEINGK